MAQMNKDTPKNIKELLGKIISGTVIQCEPYGVFVDIDDEFDLEYVGLLEMIQILDSEKTPIIFPNPDVELLDFTPPKIGTWLEAVVIGFRPDDGQVDLCVKPSVLDPARQKRNE